MEKYKDLRDLILNTTEPLIIRSVHPQWSCFANCTLREWAKRFDDESKKPTQFERNSVKCGNTPQWERYRQIVHLSVQQFLDEHSVEQDYWSGLQYKRTQELPTSCVEGIDFDVFGFPDATEDATLWLSAKGANTPCHYDTYGCNIVCQQFGRKSWFLLPPGTPLNTCRVPYEESSVYCRENFYAPQSQDIDVLSVQLSRCAHHCILEAGDVLIVPRHWWHFVEALDISLTVNTWLPLNVDIEAQLDECIVKYIMESSIRHNTQAAEQLLNPNQLSSVTDENQLLQLIQHLHNKTNTTLKRRKPKAEELEHCYPYQYMQQNDVNILLARMPNVEKLSCMTDAQLKKFLIHNSQRFDAQHTQNELSQLDVVREALLNSMCEPKAIANIKTEFCKRLNAM